jgi:hypothetical protein
MTFEIKVCKYADVVPFLEVKITSYDSSKQEQKSHRSLL